VESSGRGRERLTQTHSLIHTEGPERGNEEDGGDSVDHGESPAPDVTISAGEQLDWDLRHCHTEMNLSLSSFLWIECQ
jgi:hypothetical protein